MISASSPRPDSLPQEGVTYTAAQLWIWVSVWLSATGWILSVFHRLDRTGYVLSFALGCVVLALWISRAGWLRLVGGWRKLLRLPRTLFHLLFSIVWMLALIGGILHEPNN